MPRLLVLVFQCEVEEEKHDKKTKEKKKELEEKTTWPPQSSGSLSGTEEEEEGEETSSVWAADDGKTSFPLGLHCHLHHLLPNIISLIMFFPPLPPPLPLTGSVPPPSVALRPPASQTLITREYPRAKSLQQTSGVRR